MIYWSLSCKLLHVFAELFGILEQFDELNVFILFEVWSYRAEMCAVLCWTKHDAVEVIEREGLHFYILNSNHMYDW
jgi:hypothetical protein